MPSTSSPTAKPTTSPSKYPTTRKPTFIGETNPPNSRPTSVPTFLKDQYLNDIAYQYFVSTKSSLENETNLVTFSSYFYKRSSLFGNCQSWQEFIYSTMYRPFEDEVYTSVQVAFDQFDYSTGNNLVVNYTCSEPTIANNIINSLQLGKKYFATCDEATWRVYTCNEKQISVLIVLILAKMNIPARVSH
jgi:hypothetical protein